MVKTEMALFIWLPKFVNVAWIMFVTCETNKEGTMGDNALWNNTSPTDASVNLTGMVFSSKSTDQTSAFNTNVTTTVDYIEPTDISNITNTTTNTQKETTVVYYIQLGIAGGVPFVIVLITVMTLCSRGEKRRCQITQLSTSEANETHEEECRYRQTSESTDDASSPQNGLVFLANASELLNDGSSPENQSYNDSTHEYHHLNYSSKFDGHGGFIEDGEFNASNSRARVVSVFEKPWDTELSNFNTLLSQIKYNGVTRERDILNS